MFYINFEQPFIGSSRRLHLLLKFFIIAMARYSECFPRIELASAIDGDDEVTASLAFVTRKYPYIDDDDVVVGEMVP